MIFFRTCCVFLMFSLFSLMQSKAQELNDSIKEEAENLDQILSQYFEGQWFLAYQYKRLNHEETNQFRLKRGYITFKHKFNERFDVRFTQDITLDEEGDDAGNVEMRLKYCYLNINLGEFAFFHNPQFEIGMVHRPWIEFEQAINLYRVQGKMFLSKNSILGSADFGLTFSALLGGRINQQFINRTGTKQKGKYGSLSVGIYNGGGYHALEKNNSKTIEGRLTIRPLPKIIPGFKLSYHGIYGKGNTELNPDYIVNSGFISYESKHLVFTGQYYRGKGNMSGSFADSLGFAYKSKGFSLFGEYKIPKTRMTLFGRYDDFSVKNNKWLTNKTYIAGVGYYFYKNSKFILDVEHMDWDSRGMGTTVFYEAAIEIIF